MFDKVITSADFAMRLYMRVRSRIAPRGIGLTVFGFKMHCDTRDFIQRRVFYFKIYEPNLSYYIKSLVKSGDHVLDIGSNVGYITLLMSSLVGDDGKVVAIEASPSTYAALQRNLELNGTRNVIALNMAATGGPCLVEIVEGEKNNSGTNSIRVLPGSGSVTVKGDALSNIADIDAHKVAFIKIDVEGSEAPVLQTIVDMMADFTSLQSIAVEMTPSSAAFFDRLVACGFQPYALPNNYRIGYMFVRNYLRQSDEEGFVVKLPMKAYDEKYRDYVFERVV